MHVVVSSSWNVANQVSKASGWQFVIIVHVCSDMAQQLFQFSLGPVTPEDEAHGR
jgi:hypothetical protein